MHSVNIRRRRRPKASAQSTRGETQIFHDGRKKILPPAASSQLRTHTDEAPMSPHTNSLGCVAQLAGALRHRARALALKMAIQVSRARTQKCVCLRACAQRPHAQRSANTVSFSQEVATLRRALLSCHRAWLQRNRNNSRASARATCQRSREKSRTQSPRGRIKCSILLFAGARARACLCSYSQLAQASPQK